MTEWLYLVERLDGKQLAVFQSRHNARGYIATLDGCKPEWYTIEPVNPLVTLVWTPRVRPDTFDSHPGYPATPEDYNPVNEHV